MSSFYIVLLKDGGASNHSTPPNKTEQKPPVAYAQIWTPAWGDATYGIPKPTPQSSCSHSNVPHK